MAPPTTCRGAYRRRSRASERRRPPVLRWLARAVLHCYALSAGCGNCATAEQTTAGKVVPVADEKTETLRLRITVVDPPPNISWALQLGRDELIEPTASTAARISFEFSVEVVAGDSSAALRLRGPAIQGRSGQR